LPDLSTAVWFGNGLNGILPSLYHEFVDQVTLICRGPIYGYNSLCDLSQTFSENHDSS